MCVVQSLEANGREANEISLFDHLTVGNIDQLALGVVSYRHHIMFSLKYDSATKTLILSDISRDRYVSELAEHTRLFSLVKKRTGKQKYWEDT